MSETPNIKNSMLLRQLKRAASVSNLEGLTDWLQHIPQPQREHVCKLLALVQTYYEQSERDLDLRSRSLDLSSRELTQVNERLRQETATQHAAIRTLRLTANELLANAGLPSISADDQDLAGLSALMKQLAEEREIALKESRQSQERFELVIDSTEDGIWDWDIDNSHVYYSPRWLDMLGYGPDELPQNPETWRMLVHPDDMEDVRPILAAHLQGLTVDYNVQFRMRHKEGDWRWIRARGKVVRRDQHNRPQRMVGTHIDITLQRQHEQEVRDKLHFVEELMEILPNPIYFQGLDGRYLGFNKAWEKFFGKSRRNWIGHTVHELFDSELANQHHQLDVELYRDGGVQSFETQVVLPDGTVRDTLYSKAVFSKADGTKAGIIGTIVDITERKNAQRELEAARDAAEAANRAKSDFLANMSHEIRTPMNGIIGMTDLALDMALDQMQREYLNLVKVSSNALLSIINDILDFSKIEAGRITLEETEFDLRHTIEEIIRPLQLRAQDKGLQIITIEDEPIPGKLVGDPLRLRQVLTNLVGNAIKFTERGEIIVRTSLVGSNAAATTLQVSVQDTGIGIPADKLELIFQSFSQADTSITRQYGGTGLGLTISRRLVELMGGKIWVDSTPGWGSTFHFTLKFKHAAASLPASTQPTLTATGKSNVARQTPVQNHRLDILLAEDNRINQTLACTLLEKMGHRVTVADTGVQALLLYKKQNFDLILMDVQMPEMGGIEATQAIRQLEHGHDRHIPIIALTAHAMQGDEQKCLEAGMDSYLAKPIHRKKLQETLEHFENHLRQQSATGQQPTNPAPAQANTH
ncbi:MAG: PAS domain S-box protein [Burkholderiaceae bacterium]|nr:MAG: PAS domain S-box protein [Burkholderiaceae bacterium]